MWRRGVSCSSMPDASRVSIRAGSRGYGEFVTDNPLVQGVGDLRGHEVRSDRSDASTRPERDERERLF